MDAAVLDKIEKMLELQARAATPGEAEAATAGITRLLTKHNLELAEVRRRLGQKAPDSAYVHVRFDLGGDDGWKRSLASVLAREHFCRLYVMAGKTEVGIVGEEANIEVVKRLTFTLIPTILGQARAERRRAEQAGQVPEVWTDGRRTKRGYVPGGYKPEGVWAFITSYAQGAVEGIKQAIQAAKEQAVAEDAHGSALVIAKAEELQEAWLRTMAGKTRAAAIRGSSGSAYGQGVAYGRSLNVGAEQVEG